MSSRRPYWDGTRIWKAPDFTWGNRIGGTTRERAAQHLVPRLPQRQPDVGPLDQPDESRGPAHDQDRLLHNHSLKREIIAALLSATTSGRQLRERHGERLRHVVRVRQCGDRQLHLVHPGSGILEGTLHLHQPRGLRAGQLEGEQTADARLRRPLRARDAAVRQADAGRQFPAGRWSRSAAPTVYMFGCANGVYPCTGTNRQAMNPLTGQFLGPNTRWPSARWCRAPATRQRPVLARPGDRQDELHLPEARRRDRASAWPTT